jgi:hypothetical protein
MMNQNWSSEDFSERTLERSANEDFWDPIPQASAPASQTTPVEDEIFRFFPVSPSNPVAPHNQRTGYWGPDDFDGAKDHVADVNDPWEASPPAFPR